MGKLPATVGGVKALCQDLQLLGRSEFKQLLEHCHCCSAYLSGVCGSVLCTAGNMRCVVKIPYQDTSCRAVCSYSNLVLDTEPVCAFSIYTVLVHVSGVYAMCQQHFLT